MCSIFGIGLFADHTVDSTTVIKGIMSGLLNEAEIGGRSASGIAVMRAKTAEVIRRDLSGSELSRNKEYIDFANKYMKVGKDEPSSDDPLLSIIGHCRLPTKGSAKNNYNNHPIVTENIIGIHNGIISNDDALFNKFRKNVTRIAQVDTEIIFQLVSHFTRRFGTNSTVKAIKETADYIKGGYACGMLNVDSPYNLFLFRDGPPIRILYYPEVKAILFATRETFILKATDPFESCLGDAVEIEVISGMGIAFNLHTKTMCKFKL
jgi:glucosamine 6-phosphate synthetase-like amidotransferase/phosphosugar isomerase protein